MASRQRGWMVSGVTQAFVKRNFGVLASSGDLLRGLQAWAAIVT